MAFNRQINSGKTVLTLLATVHYSINSTQQSIEHLNTFIYKKKHCTVIHCNAFMKHFAAYTKSTSVDFSIQIPVVKQNTVQHYYQTDKHCKKRKD